MSELNKLLNKLIRDNAGKAKLFTAMIGLTIAILLLLISVQLQLNFNELLNSKNNKDSIANFLIINKEITDASLGNTQLDDSIINKIKAQPFTESVGLLSPSRFKASIESNSSRFPFYTDISFETVAADFIDLKESNWTWNEQSPYVPIIIPTLFLDFYNFQFSLSQNLPQFTPAVVKMILFKVTVYGKNGSRSFNGKIVGFSDRISSMIVPPEFMNWGNNLFASNTKNQVSRVIIKTKDPGNPELIKFLRQNQLTTDSDKTRFSKYRNVVDIVVKLTGFTGLILFIFSILIFTLFIQITIANCKEEINLLIVLGISPNQLRKFLMSRFFPIYCWLVSVATIIVMVLQYFLHSILAKQLVMISPFISFITLITALLVILVIWWANKSTIQKAVYQKNTK
jgi:cell division protein FtsX